MLSMEGNDEGNETKFLLWLAQEYGLFSLKI
jgi:hypothetical protein